MPTESIKFPTTKFCAGALIGIVALALVWQGGRALAQSSAIIMQGEFTTVEHYPPPHQNQVKSVLSGAEALPQSAGCYLVKQLKLETFRETGEREIIVKAPECLYDTKQHMASSSGQLQVQTGDGRFFIEGDGFLWLQNESHLMISNRVHTVIREATQTEHKS